MLLNILIALYNSAYEDITDNAIDEYMALFSQKTMQFVRAPDENVFIAREQPTTPLCLKNLFFIHANQPRLGPLSIQPDRNIFPHPPF